MNANDYFDPRRAAIPSPPYSPPAVRRIDRRSGAQGQGFPVLHDRARTRSHQHRRRSNSLQRAGAGQERRLAAQPATTIPTPYFDWRYNGRWDHRINDKNNLFFSYTNQHNNGLNDQSGFQQRLDGWQFHHQPVDPGQSQPQLGDHSDRRECRYVRVPVLEQRDRLKNQSSNRDFCAAANTSEPTAMSRSSRFRRSGSSRTICRSPRAGTISRWASITCTSRRSAASSNSRPLRMSPSSPTRARSLSDQALIPAGLRDSRRSYQQYLGNLRQPILSPEHQYVRPVFPG